MLKVELVLKVILDQKEVQEQLDQLDLKVDKVLVL